MKKIIFYAPIGTRLPAHLLGGGEKGCRRTLEILEKEGYEVIVIDKPIRGLGIGNYIKMALKAYIKLVKQLITDKEAILYVVGFYEKNIYLEWLNIATGRLLKHPMVYEARNGRLVKAYSEYGKLYKLLMDNVLKSVDVIFAQGLEYIEFIQKKYNKTAVYTPNYVMNRNLKPYFGNRPFDTIELVYFGRVSESKNVDLVIKTLKALIAKGYNPRLTVIGGYTEEYKKTLDSLIQEEKIAENMVDFMGQQPFEVIVDVLQKSHFFVFPSQEKMEGHSNSLTEAMTFGVVPVVSTAGFNESIVSKEKLVAHDMNPQTYADIIEGVLREKLWNEYSEYVYNRIKENYTEDRVRTNIISAISEIGQ